MNLRILEVGMLNNLALEFKCLVNNLTFFGLSLICLVSAMGLKTRVDPHTLRALFVDFIVFFDSVDASVARNLSVARRTEVGIIRIFANASLNRFWTIGNTGFPIPTEVVVAERESNQAQEALNGPQKIVIPFVVFFCTLTIIFMNDRIYILRANITVSVWLSALVPLLRNHNVRACQLQHEK